MKPLITLIGCGKMGSAMLHGWISDDRLEADFAVIEPFADHLGWTRDHSNVQVFADASDAAATGRVASMIVLAVKPQMMDEALKGLSGLVGENTTFLSIAAGITTDWFRQRLGADATVLRSMPNTPAAIGRGITALFAGGASEEVAELAVTLLSAVGSVVELEDEDLMDAVTAVSGSGPAYVFLLAEAMTAAGIDAGLPSELAKKLAEATVAGAGALIEESEDAPDQLRINVTSKGGTTAAALGVLMADDGMHALLRRAVLAARDRSVELAG